MKEEKYIPKHKNGYTISNPYNIPVHDQGNKNNCTSHAYALSLEYKLSNFFKERTLVDVDDLWEKQKKFGKASEICGDTLEGPFLITEKYGVKFKTESGPTGTYLNGKIIMDVESNSTKEAKNSSINKYRPKVLILYFKIKLMWLYYKIFK